MRQGRRFVKVPVLFSPDVYYTVGCDQYLLFLVFGIFDEFNCILFPVLFLLQ